MKSMFLLLVLVACKKPQPSPEPVAEPAPAPASEPAPEPAPTGAPEPAPAGDPPTEDDLRSLARKMSVRDPEPDCATVEAAMTTDPLATWLAFIDKVSQPPYAPMRAADCVIHHHGAAARDTLVTWVTDPSKQGLGRLVLANIEDLPEDVAEAVKTAARDGPLAEEL